LNAAFGAALPERLSDRAAASKLDESLIREWTVCRWVGYLGKRLTVRIGERQTSPSETIGDSEFNNMHP
jgi:hypothetical protein